MTSRRIALWAALAAAAAWTLKSFAIGLAGGLDRSPAESPLFLLGLLCFVVAAVALGVALTFGRPIWQRVAAGLGGFVVGFALTMLVDAAVGAFHGTGAERHWVWSEFNLWVGATVAVGVALSANRTERSRTAPA